MLLPKQGMFSKASRDPSALERTQIENQMFKQNNDTLTDGPWYPGGSKMDTHQSRVKYANDYSMKKIEKLGLSGSVERNRSKDQIIGPGKMISPDYLGKHLNSVKAKNRRNSGAKYVETKKFNAE